MRKKEKMQMNPLIYREKISNFERIKAITQMRKCTPTRTHAFSVF